MASVLSGSPELVLPVWFQKATPAFTGTICIWVVGCMILLRSGALVRYSDVWDPIRPVLGGLMLQPCGSCPLCMQSLSQDGILCSGGWRDTKVFTQWPLPNFQPHAFIQTALSLILLLLSYQSPDHTDRQPSIHIFSRDNSVSAMQCELVYCSQPHVGEEVPLQKLRGPSPNAAVPKPWLLFGPPPTPTLSG